MQPVLQRREVHYEIEILDGSVTVLQATGIVELVRGINLFKTPERVQEDRMDVPKVRIVPDMPIDDGQQESRSLKASSGDDSIKIGCQGTNM